MGIVIDVLSVSDFFVVGVVTEAVMGTKNTSNHRMSFFAIFFKGCKMLLEVGKNSNNFLLNYLHHLRFLDFSPTFQVLSFLQ